MTKSCEHHEILLSAFLDDDLEPSERLEAVDHLARCAECRSFYREARAVDGLTRAADPAPQPVPAELWAGIESAARPSRPSHTYRWWLQVAALLVVVLGVGLVVGARVRTTDEPPLPSRMEVDLGSRDMTEARFLEITREVLESDPRYQRVMLQVMDEVLTNVPASEGGGDALTIDDDEVDQPRDRA